MLLPVLLVAFQMEDVAARAGTYIQKARETMDFSYLDRAANLLSPDSSYESQRLLTEVLLERHEFAKAAEASRRLIETNASDPWNYGTLGDALIEMGDYDGAAEAYQRMVRLRPDLSSYNRAAWFRYLSGDVPAAIAIMQRAIESGSRAPENVAWCYVELGHIQAKRAHWDAARSAYESARRLLPGYHAAEAGLGRVAAAQGDLAAAIEHYRRAQAAVPLPDYGAALHDLYLASGKTADAEKQMQLIDVIFTLGQAAKEKVNRNLAMVYADHDRRPAEALSLAQAELEVRRDIFTWDALAWALYKNGKLEEAEAASVRARAMAAPEPAFYYHAGLIAKALGKREEACALLTQSLTTNPNFDIRQAPIARRALEELTQ